MKNITKDIFLNYFICPTLAWIYKNEKLPEVETIGDRLRQETGIKVGEMARELYPDGVFPGELDISHLSKKTKELISDPEIPAIFEEAFQVESLVTRADILLR